MDRALFWFLRIWVGVAVVVNVVAITGLVISANVFFGMAGTVSRTFIVLSI
jgi:hypothetical protein